MQKRQNADMSCRTNRQTCKKCGFMYTFATSTICYMCGTNLGGSEKNHDQRGNGNAGNAGNGKGSRGKGSSGKGSGKGSGRAGHFCKPQFMGKAWPRTRCLGCTLEVNANRTVCPQCHSRMPEDHVRKAKAAHEKALANWGPRGGASGSVHGNGNGSNDGRVKKLEQQLADANKRLAQQAGGAGAGGADSGLPGNALEDNGEEGKSMDQRIKELQMAIGCVKDNGMDPTVLQGKLDELIRQKEEAASKKPLSPEKQWHRLQDKKKKLAGHRKEGESLVGQMEALQTKLDANKELVARLEKEVDDLAKVVQENSAKAVPPDNVLQSYLAGVEDMEGHPGYKNLESLLHQVAQARGLIEKDRPAKVEATTTATATGAGGVERAGGLQGTPRTAPEVPEEIEQMELENLDMDNEDDVDQYYTGTLMATPPERGTAKRKDAVQGLVKQQQIAKKKRQKLIAVRSGS